MDIREATEEDIPQIISLLKISLGESLMPKSEEYWRWKHIDNPFGRSPVLLAWDRTELVGVRAFMRWEWEGKGNIYKAVRAVDTATHPEYQGRGIFKKLTLALADRCTQAGDHFVFNTPNQQSRPGYLKMGWSEAGKVIIQGRIRKPFKLLRNVVSGAPENKTDTNRKIDGHFFTSSGLARIIKDQSNTGDLITKISPEYLKWRYHDVPVADYVGICDFVGDSISGLIIGRVKQGRFGKEFRITDMFYNGSPQPTLRKRFANAMESLDIDYCTVSAKRNKYFKELASGLLLTGAFGPTVTVRPLQMQNITDLNGFRNWSPSLGDLELF